MSLLGRLTAAFLAESAALAALWLAMGGAAAVLSAAATGGRPLPLRPLLPRALAGAAGALAVGSLAARLSLPEPLWLQIGRREVPAVWSLAGALVGAAAHLLAARRRAGSPA